MSFAHASFDSRGFLVAAFDGLRAAAEGDVLSYMNRRAPPPLCHFIYSSFCCRTEQCVAPVYERVASLSHAPRQIL